jgi:hypothetical protein
MRKNRYNSSWRARTGPFSGGHLTDEDLIRSLDGELSSKETAEADAHILSCWSCRGRRQAIEEGIGDLVEYQNAIATPYLPPPLHDRAIFLARLDALAAGLGRPSRFVTMLRETIRMLGIHPLNRVAQVAGILLLVTSGLALYFLQTTRIVSADELLNRATVSDMNTLKAVAEPVVIQRLRVHVGRQLLTRTIYRDIAHNRITSRTDVSGLGKELVRAAYLRSSLDWNTPLDAKTYRSWRSRHADGQDTVIQHESGEVTLQTKLTAGPVAEADLTVRTSDYHAIAERYQLADHSEIEIAELSYDVIPLAALHENVFAPLPEPSLPRFPVAVLPEPMSPNDAGLANAQVQAEMTLHKLGGDLGEEIEIKIRPEREIVVEGVVTDESRKQQVQAELQKIAGVRMHILTIAEAAQQPSRGSGAALRPGASAQTMSASLPLLDSELNARFPDNDQRMAYVNQALSLAQLASARAWALYRLADRHPSQDVARLSDPSRRELQALLIDHISVLREDVSLLQNQLAQVLSRSSNTPAANTAVSARNNAAVSESQRDWRIRIHRVHSSIETIHEATATLLTSSPINNTSNVEEIEINLRTSLTEMQTELQDLDQEVRKGNLK